MLDHLREFLVAAGAPEADIERAATEGWLPLLALDRALMPGEGRYDTDGVARAAGTTPEIAARVWRALGFPDIPEGIAAFTERDVSALRLVVNRLENGRTQVADLEHQIRVVSASLARLASFEADLAAEALEALRASGMAEEDVAAQIVEDVDWETLTALLDYVHRVLFRAALWRRLARPGGGATVELGVGFCDLVGYTELANHIQEHELSDLLTRFEALAFDTVAAANGRVVKTIGDEVMFVGAPAEVARIALDLVERVAADPVLPDVRIGIAYGSLLARDGDYYGPVVNLASRVTARARRATILASEPMRRVLADDPQLTWRFLGPKRIRGIGEAKLYVLRRVA